MLLLEKVFEVINKSGLDYCVQNKYEIMPEEIPSDIDIMYSGCDERRLDHIVVDISQKTGLIITQKIVHDYYQFTYILSPVCPGTAFRLQLDFSQALSLHGYKNVMPGIDMLRTKKQYKCFYIPNSEVEFVYIIMRRIIKHDLASEHLRKANSLLKTDSEKCVLYTQEVFGKAVARIIIDFVKKESVTDFESNYDLLRKELLRISKRNSTLHFKVREATFNLFCVLPQRIIKPVGMSVAFLAPDGAGKSTLIDGVVDTCAGSFFGIEKYYFRPKLLKNAGSYKLKNPHGEAETNPKPHDVKLDSKSKSVVRFLFYTLDFILGYNIKVRKNLVQKKLVLFDRYYYDYYADMQRYGYSLSSRFAQRMSFLIPKPDLILVLQGDADVFHNRKDELSIEEIQRQLAAYREVLKIKNAVAIKADEEVDIVLREATKTILCQQAKSTIKRMKISSEEKTKCVNQLENLSKEM